MTTPTTTASPWPARCAYISAAIFTAASGLTNLTYGWQKGSDLATSLVWSGVAGAVAIVFALSWPALIRSVDAKRYGAALIAFVAHALVRRLHVTAALGCAAGGRANAAATETATTDARTKAQAAYDAAKAELDAVTGAKPATELQLLIEGAKAELAKLPAARSVAEVEASLRATQREPQRYGCAFINGSMAMSCPKLDAELARARQRERLTAKIAGWNEEIERVDQRRAEQRSAGAGRDEHGVGRVGEATDGEGGEQRRQGARSIPRGARRRRDAGAFKRSACAVGRLHDRGWWRSVACDRHGAVRARPGALQGRTLWKRRPQPPNLNSCARPRRPRRTL